MYFMNLTSLLLFSSGCVTHFYVRITLQQYAVSPNVCTVLFNKKHNRMQIKNHTFVYRSCGKVIASLKKENYYSLKIEPIATIFRKKSRELQRAKSLLQGIERNY